jgi:hypothetical protein
MEKILNDFLNKDWNGIKHGHLLYLFESCMLEGGDVCESTIMKKKNLQRNMEHKVGQFEIG